VGQSDIRASFGAPWAVERFDAKQSISIFVALRDIANERKIDLATLYFPQIPLESSLRNITKRNNLLLDHLLKKSKGHLQLGLDLRGGVAFTLEVDENAAAQVGEAERTEKLTKAIEIIGERIDGMGVAEPVVRAIGTNRIEVQLPGINTRDNPEVLDAVKKPARLDFRLVYPNAVPGQGADVPPLYEVKTIESEGSKGETITDELYVKRTAEMTGDGVDSAFPTVDEFGRYRINLRFSSAGSKQFAAVTAEVARQTQEMRSRGGDPRARAQLAILLDGKVYSAPGVEEEISGGSAVITGQFTRREAEELSNVLNNPLDLPLIVREQYEVGPSLAADSISSATRAFILSVAVTAALIIVFYKVGGFLAVMAMALNVVIILGVMANIGATLSMPGIAGIVLTIGMSVDSNILIFERMREELKLGKSLPAALEAGFEKAFSAILDSNLTTLITAGIMIWLGTGAVKGFGVTLAIGIFSTMFAALVISRLFLNLVIHGGCVKSMAFIPLLGNTNYDFLKHARKAFIVSWVLVAVGAATIFIKGDKIYGIDFKGGDQVTLSFEQKIPLEQIRAAAVSVGIADFSPSYTRLIGSDGEVLRITLPFDQGKPLVEALKAAHPDAKLNVTGESRIGPSVGVEIRKNAAWAIFWSLVLIFVYVAFRFEFGYGIGAVVSTLHDVIMTIGIFVLFDRQFNAAMVAAILLIVGYSINDTVVVFDRIREELKLNPTSSLRNVINNSLNLTLSRTIMTGGTTLLTAIVLTVVTDGAVNDIAFTLIIGVVTGTFSSLFIASPIFYWWHKGDRGHVEKGHDAKPVYDWEVQTKASR
jgi:SecD/SecF fusion protein